MRPWSSAASLLHLIFGTHPCRYLVQPLQSLAAEQHELPTVLLLLDALDEADDGSGNGWGPVAALIARESVHWGALGLTLFPG